MSTDKIQLVVTKREVTGKKVAALRDAEMVPAVIYGKDFTPLNVQAPYLTLTKAIRAAGTHTPVELDIDGQQQTAIVKSIDMDYVNNRVAHVSFQAVSQDQIVTTEVPVVVVDEDESEAKKAGLMLMQSVEELEVKAKPGDLPERLEISARQLKEHGDKLTLADIKLPDGVELTEDDQNLTIATVQDPAVIAAANEAADKAAEAEQKAKAAPAEGEAAPAEGDEAAPEGEQPAESAETKSE
jgi:large subunit ribosomal protein L25